jgi:hypothetical protein
LATFDAKHWPPPEHTLFHVSKHETFRNFKAQLLDYFGYSQQHQSRLWVIINRDNNTVRADAEYQDEPATSIISATFTRPHSYT